MKEAFTKIKEAIANIHRVVKTDEDLEWNRAIYKCSTIVSEVEEEYGNGWIPVEKALPEDGQRVLTVSIPNIETHQVNIEYYRKHYRHWRNGVILAWMPLPPPYTPTTD